MKTALHLITVALLIAVIVLQIMLMRQKAARPINECPSAHFNHYQIAIADTAEYGENVIHIRQRGNHIATITTDWSHGIDSVINQFNKFNPEENE